MTWHKLPNSKELADKLVEFAREVSSARGDYPLTQAQARLVAEMIAAALEHELVTRPVVFASESPVASPPLAARAAVDEEPPPKPSSGPAVWDLVVEDVRGYAVELWPNRDQVASDMTARDAVGQQRYGTRLQPHNGRNALVDAYQEALDACVYLKQSLLEKYDGEVVACYHAALTQALDLNRIINREAGRGR